MSMIVDITTAIVTALNGASLSLPFTAERHYQPVFELEEMSTLTITVVPRDMSLDKETRATLRKELAVDVGIMKKLDDIEGAAATTEIDGLIALVEEIVDLLSAEAQWQLGGARWIKTENEPIYDPEHLHKFHQFSSLVTLTYRKVST